MSRAGYNAGMADPIIAVQNCVYRYGRAERPAVDHLSFEVHPGETVGLLGPNGAGKTTMLHMVLGLVQPTSGTIAVFGRSPIAQRLAVLARLNFVSVEADLPSNLTIAECLTTFAALYRVPRAAARIADLTERFELAAMRRRLIGSLSSGEQTRLKFCKALLNAPELLLLDEPTLHLDPYMAQKIRAHLQAIQREHRLAILYTSHNMQEVETFCHRILFLHRGTLLAQGAPQETLDRFKSRSLEELFIRVSQSGELFHGE